MILDLNMPQMSGFALLQELEIRGWRGFPILVVSGSRDAERVVPGLADALLSKPLDLDDLSMTVRQLLSR